jgi:hypothetical protein
MRGARGVRDLDGIRVGKDPAYLETRAYRFSRETGTSQKYVIYLLFSRVLRPRPSLGLASWKDRKVRSWPQYYVPGSTGVPLEAAPSSHGRPGSDLVRVTGGRGPSLVSNQVRHVKLWCLRELADALVN